MELGISDNHPQLAATEEPTVEEMERVLRGEGQFSLDEFAKVCYAKINIKTPNCEWSFKRRGLNYSDAIRRLYCDYFTIKHQISPVAAEILYGTQETTEAPF